MKNRNNHSGNSNQLNQLKKLKDSFELEDFENDTDDTDDTKQRRHSANELDQLMSASFAAPSKKLTPGSKVKCELIVAGDEEILFSIKSERSGRPLDGAVPRRELLNSEGNFSYKVGDLLDLYITRTKGPMISLSASPMAKTQAEDLIDSYKSALPIEGKITEACNGGVRVLVRGKSAFCPISQIDIVRVDNVESYIGQKFDFVITDFSEGGRNIVVSRRRLLQAERAQSEKAFLSERREGDIVSGRVKKLEAFGAFVEIAPGVEGLVHISELSWSRVDNPGEAVSVGQEVVAKILKQEQKDGRLKISLSIKQASSEPWSNLANDFKEGQMVSGKVTRCVKFGAFVEVAPGIEGLVPLSEMSHSKRVMRSDELFKEGDKITVMIKEIHTSNKRMLLSLKDAGEDPWALVAEKFPVGSIVTGRVTRREAYGIFVELEEGVIGLLPKSKANENPDFHYDKIKVTDTLSVQIGELHLSDRRISLSPPGDPDKDEWKNHLQEKASKSASSTASSKEFKSTFASKLKNFPLK
ncbi:MAG: S1 RNA-binding domain-containing protein [Oligoflexia bacterium]|nr:S1 RNA-binding domain-containing protein [Oligoflexia bacterium]MBF0367206.1 S1 RNA-binding domain-containing protein [Oligoflexia bacterium]